MAWLETATFGTVAVFDKCQKTTKSLHLNRYGNIIKKLYLFWKLRIFTVTCLRKAFEVT